MAAKHSGNSGTALAGPGETPLLQPRPISPQVQVAMRASTAWFAAAQKLLSDVRGELSDMVVLPSELERDRKAPTRRLERSAPDPLRLRTSGDDSADAEPVGPDAAQAAELDPDDAACDPAESLDDEPVSSGATSSSLDAYLRQLRRVKAPTLEEEKVLVRAAQAGEPDAVNQLVSRCLRIVPPIARSFVGRGLPLEDLIEEGNLGLYRAVPRFDLALGHRFATYARWWVKHEIRTAVLNQGRLIRLPVHVFRALSRVRRQLESVGQAMPYELRASDEPAAGDSSDDITRLTLVEAQGLLRLTELPLSLDMPFESDSETPLVDTLAGEIDESPEARIQQEQRARLLTSAVERLSANEREVVLRRYGFATGEPETLEAIGKTLKLTAERVRQIQKQALLSIQQDFAQRGLALDQLL